MSLFLPLLQHVQSGPKSGKLRVYPRTTVGGSLFGRPLFRDVFFFFFLLFGGSSSPRQLSELI